MKVTYDFSVKDCIKNLGLDEGGRVQQVVTNEVITLSEPYVPKAEGDLINSAHVENGTDAVWSTPYAHYMWGGIVYEDPILHCAGFQVEDGGWLSRRQDRGAPQKVPTDRKLEYQNGSLRGSKWVPRMLQDGGAKKIENEARKAVRK